MAKYYGSWGTSWEDLAAPYDRFPDRLGTVKQKKATFAPKANFTARDFGPMEDYAPSEFKTRDFSATKFKPAQGLKQTKTLARKTPQAFVDSPGKAILDKIASIDPQRAAKVGAAWKKKNVLQGVAMLKGGPKAQKKGLKRLYKAAAGATVTPDEGLGIETGEDKAKKRRRRYGGSGLSPTY
jgi:hypothetical protein